MVPRVRVAPDSTALLPYVIPVFLLVILAMRLRETVAQLVG